MTCLASVLQRSINQLKEVFNSLNILTQFIGPVKKAPARAPMDRTARSRATLEEIESGKLKELFLEKNNKLDRMQSHRDALVEDYY